MTHLRLAARRLLVRSAILVPFVLVSVGHTQARVEVISTMLRHVTVVEVPDPVENVALGNSTDLTVQWHGNNVLVEPKKPGIDTNMVVFTRKTTYMYEIREAPSAEDMSWIVSEKAPPAPPKPAGPSMAEIQRGRDKLYVSLLLSTKDLDTGSIPIRKHVVNVWVTQVSEDDRNFYVKMRATNNGKHTYRLQNPSVMKIDPAFGADMAYRNVYKQISADIFKQFRAYQQTPISLHGSTLDMVDMPPDTTMDWVLAISKPQVLPAIFRFNFAADQGDQIHVAAIF